MENLVLETMQKLTDCGKTTEDVLWVGSESGKFAMDWVGFVNAFKNFTYDSGYGRNMVTQDLVVVGEDWWLERQEYDGAEWWEYKKKPQTDLATALPFAPKENGEFIFPGKEWDESVC